MGKALLPAGKGIPGPLVTLASPLPGLKVPTTITVTLRGQAGRATTLGQTTVAAAQTQLEEQTQLLLPQVMCEAGGGEPWKGGGLPWAPFGEDQAGGFGLETHLLKAVGRPRENLLFPLLTTCREVLSCLVLTAAFLAQFYPASLSVHCACPVFQVADNAAGNLACPASSPIPPSKRLPQLDLGKTQSAERLPAADPPSHPSSTVSLSVGEKERQSLLAFPSRCQSLRDVNGSSG